MDFQNVTDSVLFVLKRVIKRTASENEDYVILKREIKREPPDSNSPASQKLQTGFTSSS